MLLLFQLSDLPKLLFFHLVYTLKPPPSHRGDKVDLLAGAGNFFLAGTYMHTASQNSEGKGTPSKPPLSSFHKFRHAKKQIGHDA